MARGVLKRAPAREWGGGPSSSRSLPASAEEGRSEDLQAKIAAVAFAIFERRGCRHGHDLDDWLEAESLVRLGSDFPDVGTVRDD